MKIVTVSIDPTFGNGFGVAEALGAIPVFRQKDPKGMHFGKQALYGYYNIPKEADLYVVISGQCFHEIEDEILKLRLKQVPVKVILTDTFYLKHYESLNVLFEKWDIEVFCMPDLYHLTNDAELFYQPFNIDIPTNKAEQFTICHSPYAHQKTLEKNSKTITGIVKSLPFDIKYDFIVHLSWREALQRKARSHITIDQLRTGEYIGGVGKSGLEAMLLNSVCFSSGRPVKGKNIPPPPVVWITADTLKKKLIEVISHPVMWQDYMIRQYEWAKKYLSYEFCKKNLL